MILDGEQFSVDYFILTSRGLPKSEIDTLQEDGEFEFYDHWSRVLRPTSSEELYYASGGSELFSDGFFTIFRSGNQVELNASIRFYWQDFYDWNIDDRFHLYCKETGLNVVVADVELKALEIYANARPYKIGELTWRKSVTGRGDLRNGIVYEDWKDE